MRLLICLSAVLTVFAVGCNREMSYFECEQPDDSVQEDIGASQDVGQEDTGTPVAAALVGNACSADGDCPTVDGWAGPWCLTSEVLQGELSVYYPVPDGLCSLPDCEADEDCGSDAVCVNGGGMNYCAKACETYVDCRYTSGFACAAIGAAAMACLPDGAVYLGQCGDGVCDEDERYGETCEADCPDGFPEPILTGGPCEADGDCQAGKTCITTQFLAGLLGGGDVEVPGGMCANNPVMASCSTTEECGEGGACVDATALAGIPIKLCLHECQDDGGCRVFEGYRCFDTGTEGEPKGCLPQQLIRGIRCGDGVCDVAETFDPTLCPDDNCGGE